MMMEPQKDQLTLEMLLRQFPQQPSFPQPNQSGVNNLEQLTRNLAEGYMQGSTDKEAPRFFP